MTRLELILQLSILHCRCRQEEDPEILNAAPLIAAIAAALTFDDTAELKGLVGRWVGGKCGKYPRTLTLLPNLHASTN